MIYKRITILCGHYGSGKTNAAVNMAYDLKNQYDKVLIADLDIVNPYFRTKDSKDDLESKGITLISSEYAGTNVDIPAMPQQMYSIIDNRDYKAIIDVGGDDRGALALGRIMPSIKEENDYEMLFVINCYRPLTRDAESTLEVMREIEDACKCKFTAIVNNSNLGNETTAEDVLKSVDYANEVSRITGLPIKCTCVYGEIYESIKNQIPNAFALDLQSKIN
jgi:MinD-like ATPase involved in chromosome partitioning or flagellar assembly